MAQQPRQPFNVRVSTSALARLSPTTHVFRPKRGYFEFATHMALRHGRLQENCAAPGGATNGSLHFIKPPNGARPILCSYVANERAWMPVNRDGLRMAFAADFLGSHGWKYSTVAPGKDK